MSGLQMSSFKIVNGKLVLPKPSGMRAMWTIPEPEDFLFQPKPIEVSTISTYFGYPFPANQHISLRSQLDSKKNDTF